jgi:hypothetical protein
MRPPLGPNEIMSPSTFSSNESQADCGCVRVRRRRCLYPTWKGLVNLDRVSLSMAFDGRCESAETCDEKSRLELLLFEDV